VYISLSVSGKITRKDFKRFCYTRIEPSSRKTQTSAIVGTNRVRPQEVLRLAPSCFARMRLKLNWVKHKSRLKQESLKTYLTDWLTDWQTDWLTDWQSDWMTDRLTDWLTDGLTDWQTDWLRDWLNDRLTDRQTDWLIKYLYGRQFFLRRCEFPSLSWISPAILSKMRIHYSFLKSPLIFSFLSQMNSLYIFPFYVVKIHFNIILPFMPTFWNALFSSYFRAKSCKQFRCSPLLPHTPPIISSLAKVCLRWN
jgi:hypothetical protein